MQAARIEALQRMPIFGGLRADVLEYLLAASGTVSVRADDFFFHESDRAESMFVLEVGKVAVVRHWNGQPVLLGHLNRGDCFGEMALIDLFPRSASVLAVEACEAIELTTASFQTLYDKDLEQFALIHMNIGREVSRRLRVADDRLFRSKVGEPHGESDGAVPLT